MTEYDLFRISIGIVILIDFVVNIIAYRRADETERKALFKNFVFCMIVLIVLFALLKAKMVAKYVGT